MPGEFYIEGRTEKIDINDIKELITRMQETISDLQTDVTTIVTATGGRLSCADFWSETVDEANVEIGAAGGTKHLPAVRVEKIPSGASVLRAVAMIKFRMLENTNTDPNRLNGGTVSGMSQVIQVRDTGGDWADAINFVDDQYTVEGETREGGDVCFGTVDISAIVNRTGVYEFQWLLASPLLNYLRFCDVQMGIRIWYSVPAS